MTGDLCATCGDRVYRGELARCDGCDKPPTFCDCLRARRADEQRRAMRAAAAASGRAHAARAARMEADVSSRDDRIDGEFGTGYVGEFR